jgi:hypothetical protein
MYKVTVAEERIRKELEVCIKRHIIRTLPYMTFNVYRKFLDRSQLPLMHGHRVQTIHISQSQHITLHRPRASQTIGNFAPRLWVTQPLKGTIVVPIPLR